MSRPFIAVALLGGILGSTVQARAQHVTLINVFEVPAGALDEAVRYWEASRDVLARQPGYLSTRLHHALMPDAHFQRWMSPSILSTAC